MKEEGVLHILQWAPLPDSPTSVSVVAIAQIPRVIFRVFFLHSPCLDIYQIACSVFELPVCPHLPFLSLTLLWFRLSSLMLGCGNNLQFIPLPLKVFLPQVCLDYSSKALSCPSQCESPHSAPSVYRVKYNFWIIGPHLTCPASQLPPASLPATLNPARPSSSESGGAVCSSNLCPYPCCAHSLLATLQLLPTPTVGSGNKAARQTSWPRTVCLF